MIERHDHFEMPLEHLYEDHDAIEISLETLPHGPERRAHLAKQLALYVFEIQCKEAAYPYQPRVQEAVGDKL